MKIKILLGLFFFLGSVANAFSQEITKPLVMSVEQAAHYAKERALEERSVTYRTNGLELPFIDDFSRFSLPTNDPDVPAEWQLWTDNTARITTAMAINAPTLGVATLDGLDRTGYPYDFSSEFAYGSADTLTSCPIDLAGRTAEDSVKLIFHYQSGGLGNAPDQIDALKLEFLIPLANPPTWQEVWSVEGTQVPQSNFQRVVINISEALYLQSNFQFRFRNDATLSGNVDHWHLDYVWLDEDLVTEEFKIIDVSANGHQSSLLNTYNTVPWEHYIANPEEMAGQQQVRFSNLDEDRNISFGTTISYEGDVLATLDQGLNTALNGFSNFQQNFSINNGAPNNFSFPTDVNDTCATFEIKYYCNTTPDLNVNNDTLTFYQHFGNYYAYDDGTAEGAYALNQPGSATALKFDALQSDSLLGLLIHFSPFLFNNSDETFLLRAWADDNGIPGAELEENFNLHAPQYFNDGYDIFEFYEYDEPIFVEEGDFHVGFVQTTSAELNVGYDKQSNANTNNLNFRLGAFGEWTSSSVEGSLMIRPVFQSDKDLEWDFVDINEVELENEKVVLYPNPADDMLRSNHFKAGSKVVIYNSVGAEVLNLVLNNDQLNVSQLNSGVYLVHIIDKQGLRSYSRFIKN